ncbi:MAG: acyl-CoA dehydrogenase [Alphaproteobacteria bacterium]
MTFKAPVADILYTLDHIAGFSQLVDEGMFGELDMETVAAILEESGRFANEELAPLNRKGDETPAKLVGKDVETPSGWIEAYKLFVDGGWNALACPEEFGGQDLPVAISMAATEMWGGANMAFALGPLLTSGAVEAVSHYAAPELKARFLPKMVSGEWTGSMQLTEPQAGSDLRFLKTRAVPQEDGSYKITGTKIFITYGEHPMTENIVHLVLARLPDAPTGTKGISMFVVPKFLVGDDGSLGARNDVFCSKLEHKLGIHGSPTCVMNFGDEGGATGWLVGEANRGLNYMFLMMNRARISVGMQGIGLAEHAYQDALAYAQERRQGSAAGVPNTEMAPIIMGLTNAVALDVARHGRDEATRKRAEAEAALLTPLSKAYGSDISVEVASEALQVHGGMGFIEETGAAQHYRDARITPIYEGTNGIQALDLVGRKLLMNEGEVVRTFLAGLQEIVANVPTEANSPFGTTARCLGQGMADLVECSLWLGKKLAENPSAALAGATSYAKMFSLVAGGTLLARGALSAIRKGDNAAETQTLLARHFAETQVASSSGLKHAVYHSADTVLGEKADAILQ